MQTKDLGSQLNQIQIMPSWNTGVWRPIFLLIAIRLDPSQRNFGNILGPWDTISDLWFRKNAKNFNSHVIILMIAHLFWSWKWDIFPQQWKTRFLQGNFTIVWKLVCELMVPTLLCPFNSWWSMACNLGLLSYRQNLFDESWLPKDNGISMILGYAG